MEKLIEDYINIDERLEYMKAIAEEYAPDIDIDSETGEKYICGTTALQFFIPRYNGNKLHGHFTYDSYINNQEIQNTLNALGVDIDKFWFLLLFIFDYTCGTCLEGMKGYGNGIEQITKFAQSIVDNYAEMNQFGVTFKNPISISVKVEGKHQVIVDNSNAIAHIAASIINTLNEAEKHIWMQTQRVDFNYAEEKESVQIWLFTKMFQDFFNLIPYKDLFKGRQKKGSTTSLSKILLISRLIYFTRISKNKKFLDDEDHLKGYIKQYKDKRINTVNSIY